MEHLTWRQLIEGLNEHKIDLNDNIAIYVTQDDEYFPVVDAYICSDGVLDNGNMYLRIVR